MRTSSNDASWPVAPGDYDVGFSESPVAIVIIGRGVVDVPTDLYALKGTLKTENIGIEKIIANTVSNTRIRFLIVCGKDEFGHYPGDAILSLCRNGVDGQMRIKGSRSAIPFLCNVPIEAVERFREQVEAIDILHPKEVREIIAYDPEYEFDAERTDELVDAVKRCLERDPGRLDAEPMLVTGGAIAQEGRGIGKDLNLASDRFASQMLRMPSEKLTTSASLAIVSRDFSIILDPIDSEVVPVPSIDLAIRIKSYLTGGA